jgi:amino acid transporter
MLVVLGILAVAALSGLVYFYLSPKSTKTQKLAALGALALCGLALLICGIFLIFGNEEKKDPYAFPVAAEAAQPKPKAQVFELVIFLIALLLLFGFVVFLGYRDQKKRALGNTDINQGVAKKTAGKKAVSGEANTGSDDSDFTFDDFK